MDTWMTSSLTPLINANWGAPAGQERMQLYPMTVRVQAYEIIRTWLFYTLVKSHLHTQSLPWGNVAISGWGLNEQGKKISKRDLEAYTDQDGYNRYEPYGVIRKYGADSIRFWATGGQLGHDLKYSEKQVLVGRKLVLKLWNASRFCMMSLDGFDTDKGPMPFADRTSEDRWIMSQLQPVIQRVSESLDQYNYDAARNALDRFFWQDFCDDYLEMIKERFWRPQEYPQPQRDSAQGSIWETLRAIIAMYAPFVPFVTEQIYQKLYRPVESRTSIHVAGWPVSNPQYMSDVPEMQLVQSILYAVRSWRSTAQIPQAKRLAHLIIDERDADDGVKQDLRRMAGSIRAVSRAENVQFGPATGTCSIGGVRVDIIA